MKTTKNLLSFLSVVALASVPVLSHADSHAPPPPGVLEVWGCTYLPGQDMDDLMGARDYLVKQAEKGGIELGPAYVWTPLKTTEQIDVAWFAPHDNLAAWAASSDASGASAEMASTDARFNTVVDCSAGLYSFMPVFVREGAGDSDNDDTTHITSAACNFKHGRGEGDLPDLRNHMASTMGGMGNNTPNMTMMLDPISSGPETADMYMFSVYNSASAYASFVNALIPSEAGQSVIRHFNVLLDCDQSMWTGQQVIGGDDG